MDAHQAPVSRHFSTVRFGICRFWTSASSPTAFPPVSGFIITCTLADKLFPAGDALGKSVYVESETTPTPIIGIVDRLQGRFVDASGYFGSFTESSILAPYRLLGEYSTFAVRANPGPQIK